MDAINGVPQSGVVARTCHISVTFFIQAITASIRNNPPPMIGGDQSYILRVQAMNAMGSNSNNVYFTFFLNRLNNMEM
jgi:hypothetical protein